MKVLLVSTNTMTDPYPTYPIGLDYVANAISPRHRATIADMNRLGSKEALAAVVADEQPQVVGLSIRNIDTTDSTHVEGFAETIRELIGIVRSHTQARVVLGGPGFTILPEQWMKLLDADFGVIGEGERLPLLLDALEEDLNPSALPGIIGRDEPAVIPDPWEGAFPRGPFANLPHTSFYLQRGGMLNLQTKRGCPFRCVYCTYPHIEGRRFRFVDPEETATTARMLQDAGARYIYITDSTFNGSYEHSMAVALAFRKAGVSVPWGAFFTPTEPPDDYYGILAECGLRHVEFGTEALNDSMLHSYGKPFHRADVAAAHRLAESAGLHIAHYLMLGGPDESRETVLETLGRADELGKAVYFVFCGIRIYPHTDLYERALREGLVSPCQDLLQPTFYWSPNLDSGETADLLAAHAGGRGNWVVGSGSEITSRVLTRFHRRGHSGPLWEFMLP